MRINGQVIAPVPAAREEPPSATSGVARLCAALGLVSSIGAVIAIFLDLPLTTLALGILAYYAFRAGDACKRRVSALGLQRPEAVVPRAVEPQPGPAVEVRRSATVERPVQPASVAPNVHGSQLTSQQQAAGEAMRETTKANLLFMEIQSARGSLGDRLPKIRELIQASTRALTIAEQSTQNCRDVTRKNIKQIMQKLHDLVTPYLSSGVTLQQRPRMAALMAEAAALVHLLIDSNRRSSGVVS